MTQVSGHTARREYEKKNGNQHTTNTPMTTAKTKVKRFSLFIMAFRLAAPGLLSDLDFLPGTRRAPFEVAIISLYLLTDLGEWTPPAGEPGMLVLPLPPWLCSASLSVLELSPLLLCVFLPVCLFFFVPLSLGVSVDGEEGP